MVITVQNLKQKGTFLWVTLYLPGHKQPVKEERVLEGGDVAVYVWDLELWLWGRERLKLKRTCGIHVIICRFCAFRETLT